MLAKIRVNVSPIPANVVTTGGREYWKQMEKQLREQLEAEQKSSAGLVRATTNPDLTCTRVCASTCVSPGQTSCYA